MREDAMPAESVSASHLAYLDKPLLETVDTWLGTCDGSSDAVFAEARRLDTQLSQDGKDGRRGTTVTLEFDDHDLVHAAFLTRSVTLETDVEVYGQPLGLVHIDQGDSLEAVAHHGAKVLQVKSSGLIHEVCAFALLFHCIKRRYLNACLGGLAVIVLFLHFEKGEVRLQIGTHTHLGARLVSRFMLTEHGVISILVEIGGGITTYPLAVDHLCPVLAVDHLQQTVEGGQIGEVLLVRAVHQAYGLHLIEGDGRKCLYVLADTAEDGLHRFAEYDGRSKGINFGMMRF